MRVDITDAALADLIRIGKDIGEDNPSRAETFVAELYERCLRLGNMPRAFPLLPDWEDRGVRRRVHKSYLIFYRISADAVQILHVLHGKQDYEAILFPED